MNYECSGHVTLVSAPTPDNSVCLNFSILDEIFLRADGTRHSFVAASTLPIVNDDMADRTAVDVLQYNGEIIQPRLFILPANRPILTKRTVK
jgi:hypothetical protein